MITNGRNPIPAAFLCNFSLSNSMIKTSTSTSSKKTSFMPFLKSESLLCVESSNNFYTFWSPSLLNVIKLVTMHALLFATLIFFKSQSDFCFTNWTKSQPIMSQFLDTHLTKSASIMWSLNYFTISICWSKIVRLYMVECFAFRDAFPCWHDLKDLTPPSLPSLSKIAHFWCLIS